MDATTFKIITLFLIVWGSVESTPMRSKEVHQQNKTISELVKEQTETIKKIVASQSKPSPTDYPIVTKFNPDIKSFLKKDDQQIKQDKERQSIEELRLRCQHFFKFSSADDERAKSNGEDTTPHVPTVEAFGPQIKPEFLKQKTSTTVKLETTTSATPATRGYFIFTDKIEQPLSTEAPKPSTSFPEVVHPTPAIKYVKYEPIIYRKTLISNGQNYYYWYHAIPKRNNDQIGDNLEGQGSEIVYANVPVTESPKTTTTTVKSTTTTTTPTTQVIPNYEIVYKDPQKNPNQLPQANQEKSPVYKSQLRFVLPMAIAAYSDVQGADYRWQFDPYAYYPKQLQPEMMNVQVPYVPTFHMIRTLAVPNDNLEPKETTI